MAAGEDRASGRLGYHARYRHEYPRAQPQVPAGAKAANVGVTWALRKLASISTRGTPLRKYIEVQEAAQLHRAAGGLVLACPQAH